MHHHGKGFDFEIWTLEGSAVKLRMQEGRVFECYIYNY